MKKMRKFAATLIAMMAAVAMLVTYVPVEAAAKVPKKITLTTGVKTIDIKGKTTITVKSVSPKGASNAVSYKSSSKKIATVTSKGVVTGKKAGKVKITVTSKKNKKVKKTVTIKVKDLKPSSISVNDITLKAGAAQALNAVVKPAGVYCPLTYASSDAAVASVSADGTVKANKAGTAVITVTSKEKNSKKKVITATCKVTVTEEKKGDAFTGKYVISAKDLKAKMDAKEAMVLIDARGEAKINKAKETAKGAITFTWQDISKMPGAGEAGHCRSLDAAEMSKKLGEFGLGLDDEIYVFVKDNATQWGDDGRIVWQLTQCGYQKVKVVDGGLTEMKAAGIPMQAAASKPVAKTVEIKAIDATTHDVTTEELVRNFESYKVIDTRTDDEFNGATNYGEKSGGHMKDALHIRFTDLFNADNTLKSVAELTELFEAAGLKKDDKIATYCTGGIRSAYMQLVLEMCGFEDSHNYPESAWRWSNTSDAGTGNYWTGGWTGEEWKFAFEKEEVSTDLNGHRLTAVGAKAANTLTVTGTDAAKLNAEYSTSDEKIATVDKTTGEVTVAGFGEAVITAKANGLAASYKVKVTNRVMDEVFANWGSDADPYKVIYDEVKAHPEQYLILDTRSNSFKDADVAYNDVRFDDAQIQVVHEEVFPLDTIEKEEALRKLVTDGKLTTDKTIVAICRSGNVGAKRALSVLKEAGVEAKYLVGGGTGLKSKIGDGFVVAPGKFAFEEETVTKDVNGFDLTSIGATAKANKLVAADKISQVPENITYSSSNATIVAKVAGDGTVTTTGYGEAVITASTESGVLATYRVIVRDRDAEYKAEWETASYRVTMDQLTKETIKDYIIFDTRISDGSTKAYDSVRFKEMDGVSIVYDALYPMSKYENETAVRQMVADHKFDGDKKILIVCMGGGGGASRAMSVLKEAGISQERLTYLVNGGNDMYKAVTSQQGSEIVELVK